MEMPGRTYQSPDYRYGFNGKENDPEINEGAQDYGARMYDNRLGRWMSKDPLSFKFPNESPYNFCSSNPLIYMDPNGKEKIIVIGGADNAGEDRYKFINSGLRQMLNYAQDNPKNEPITIVVTDIFLENEAYESIQEWANATMINYGVKINVVKAKSGDDITDYINSKSTEKSNINTERTNDPITDISFFGHGYSPFYSSQGEVGGMEPGHGMPGEDMLVRENRPVHDMWSWGIEDVNRLDPNAFANNSNWDFYTCNPATPNLKGRSLVDEVSDKLPQTNVSGYWGRTRYNQIYDGRGLLFRISKYFGGGIIPSLKLPVGGSKSGGLAGNGPSVKIRKKKSSVPKFECFISETKILMGDGSSKNIEDVNIGDVILTLNEKTNVIEKQPVIEINKPVHNDMISIMFSNGKQNVNTFDHAYLVKGKGWCSYKPDLTKNRYDINAGTLMIGDIVTEYQNGKMVEITVTNIQEKIGDVQTYNIKAKTNNNYFANGILVFNEYVPNSQ